MEILEGLGYLGLFLGTFLSATVIPFSSDVLLLGVLAAGGDTVTAVIVATTGNWLGGLTSYGLGRLGKWEWIEKWLKVDRSKLEKQRTRICRHGNWAALLTWLPFVGNIFALGLGFYRAPFFSTAVYMLIGRALRFIGWALIYHGVFG